MGKGQPLSSFQICHSQTSKGLKQISVTLAVRCWEQPQLCTQQLLLFKAAFIANWDLGTEKLSPTVTCS